MEELLVLLKLKFDSTRDLLTAGLILARAMPMVFLVPFFGGQQAPNELKMSLGLMFAILCWPLAQDSLTAPVPIYAFPFLLLMLKETLIGFAIGFANSHIFAALETAGRFIDTARGAAMSEVNNPQTRSRATPIGTVYNQLLGVLFMAMGGHYVLIETFCMSFASIPINGPHQHDAGLQPLRGLCRPPLRGRAAHCRAAVGPGHCRHLPHRSGVWRAQPGGAAAQRLLHGHAGQGHGRPDPHVRRLRPLRDPPGPLHPREPGHGEEQP